jgi:hypothetical protein
MGGFVWFKDLETAAEGHDRGLRMLSALFAFFKREP